jgi:hypothetical protein
MKRTFASLAALLALTLESTVAFAAEPIVLPSAAAAPAPAAPDGDSLALVNALRLDEVLRGRAADPRQPDANLSQLQRCFSAAKPVDFSPDLAAMVPRILTRTEIRAAVEFFESPTGRKLINHNLVELAKQRGDPGSARLRDPAPTADDQRIAGAFLATPAGRKINETGYLLDAPVMQQMLAQKAAAAAVRCARSHPDGAATKP